VASNICQALGRGVTRSKRQAMTWLRRATELGHVKTCMRLTNGIYEDEPYAREVGRVEDPAVVATLAGGMEGHDVPPDVLTSVVHWLQSVGFGTYCSPRHRVSLNSINEGQICVVDVASNIRQAPADGV
jgi:TPR repeat protein